MPYEEPKVEVVRMLRSGATTETEVRLYQGDLPSDPIAPAGLYTGERAEREVIQLHKLVTRDGQTLVFESYDVSSPLPPAGDRFVLRSWWAPHQLDVASDTALGWERAIYDEGDHDHCLLTWRTIRPGDSAYRSAAGWLSVQAYNRFVRDDALRLRRDSTSS